MVHIMDIMLVLFHPYCNQTHRIMMVAVLEISSKLMMPSLFHLQVKGDYAVLLLKNLLQITTVSQDTVPFLKIKMLAEILCETISIL